MSIPSPHSASWTVLRSIVTRPAARSASIMIPAQPFGSPSIGTWTPADRRQLEREHDEADGARGVVARYVVAGHAHTRDVAAVDAAAVRAFDHQVLDPGAVREHDRVAVATGGAGVGQPRHLHGRVLTGGPEPTSRWRGCSAMRRPAPPAPRGRRSSARLGRARRPRASRTAGACCRCRPPPRRPSRTSASVWPRPPARRAAARARPREKSQVTRPLGRQTEMTPDHFGEVYDGVRSMGDARPRPLRPPRGDRPRGLRRPHRRRRRHGGGGLEPARRLGAQRRASQRPLPRRRQRRRHHKAEDDARRYFDEHGHWPDEAPRWLHAHRHGQDPRAARGDRRLRGMHSRRGSQLAAPAYVSHLRSHRLLRRLAGQTASAHWREPSIR